MPKRKRTLPTLRRHPRGQAFVELDRRRHYLGPWGSEQAQEAYDRLIGEWLANGRTMPPPPPPSIGEITVTILIRDYWREAQAERGDLANVKAALATFRAMYGSTPAIDFGPVELKAIRARMISDGLARTTINMRVRMIVHVFRWAAANRVMPPAIWESLRAVDALKRGRSDAKESKRIKPVPREHVRRIRRHLSRPVRALVDLQLLCGARSSELLGLRAVDLNTTGKVWTATLADHKTAHHDGRQRVLYFGPRAQKVLSQFMGNRPVDAPLFNPAEANAERKRIGAAGARRPDQKPNPRTTDRTIRDTYDHSSYRQAVQRACKVAGVPQWHPHQLRHNAATFIRREHGLDAVQVILGHSTVAASQVYAEVNDKRAREVIARVG